LLHLFGVALARPSKPTNEKIPQLRFGGQRFSFPKLLKMLIKYFAMEQGFCPNATSSGWPFALDELQPIMGFTTC
jgi:hypothetical protein